MLKSLKRLADWKKSRTFAATKQHKTTKDMEEKKVYKTVDELLTEEFLSDWLSTASYGNIWCSVFIHNDTSDSLYNEAKEIKETREDEMAYILKRGGSILVIDEEEERDYKVTYEDIKNGIQTFVLNYPRQWAAIVEGDADLYDADILLQWIVFGEYVYG